MNDLADFKITMAFVLSVVIIVFGSTTVYLSLTLKTAVAANNETRLIVSEEVRRVDMLQSMVSNISRQMPPMKTTWYGGKWHGRTTSSGAKFNKNGMTAAHRTLPFGTVLILEHEGKLAAVMVTDRGPMEWTGKDLDITERAAEVLGMKRKGTATLNVRRLL